MIACAEIADAITSLGAMAFTLGLVALLLR
jgi:hypothetical protein